MTRSARWLLGLVALGSAVAVGGYLAGPFASLRGQNAVPPAIPKELYSYRDIVKKVLPAVVSIESKAKPAPVGMQRRGPALDQVPEQFRRFFEGMDQFNFEMPQQPHVGFGSGFLIDPTGVILTNFHVVAGADQVDITLADGRKFTSRDIKADQKTDLAIVRLEGQKSLPHLELGDSDRMEIGDRVLAIGAPFGLTGSVTHGIVSAKGRNGLSMNMYEDFIQTDAAINPGNSGGPLVNLEGKVIGINSAIKTHSGGFQGVGLAIASNLARNVKDQLLKEGVVRRGYLGVQIKDLIDKELAQRLGLKDGEHGVLVSQVFDKSPASKAHVHAGDVITAIAGKPIKDGRELQRIVASLPLGKPSEMTVVRDGKPQALKVTIEEQPQEFGNARVPVRPAPRGDRNTVSLDKLGMEVTDLTPELAEQLGLKDQDTGAVIASVEPNGAAAEAGLRRGTVIVKVDKQAVASATSLKSALDKATLDKGVLLQVVTPQGGTSYVLLKVASAEATK